MIIPIPTIKACELVSVRYRADGRMTHLKFWTMDVWSIFLVVEWVASQTQLWALSLQTRADGHDLVWLDAIAAYEAGMSLAFRAKRLHDRLESVDVAGEVGL